MDKDFSILHKIVQSTNARQKVIASNIANADTPGYKARDVTFDNLLKKEMKLLATDPKHFSSSHGGSMRVHVITENNLSWADGNNVELNREVARMTENALRHDAAIRILNGKLKMYRNAIRGR